MILSDEMFKKLLVLLIVSRLGYEG